jgi:hypothetical protein
MLLAINKALHSLFNYADIFKQMEYCHLEPHKNDNCSNFTWGFLVLLYAISFIKQPHDSTLPWVTAIFLFMTISPQAQRHLTSRKPRFVPSGSVTYSVFADSIMVSFP